MPYWLTGGRARAPPLPSRPAAAAPDSKSGSARRRRLLAALLGNPQGSGSQNKKRGGQGGNRKLSRGPPADRVGSITPEFTFSTEDARVRPCNWVFQRHLEAKAAYFKKIIQKADIRPPVSSRKAECTGRYPEGHHHHLNNQSEAQNCRLKRPQKMLNQK